MRTGVPVDGATGAIKVAATIEGDRVASLNGEVNLGRLKLANRPVQNLTATLVKAEGRDLLQLGRIRGGIADGEISGQVDTLVSERDGRFGLSMVLRNAKVAELTGETDKPIDGRLTASLQLEGRWGRPRLAARPRRRDRGGP
jgi:hypothetical protein